MGFAPMTLPKLSSINCARTSTAGPPSATPASSGLEGIVSKRLGSIYRSGRLPNWLKFKNPEAPAVKREARRIGTMTILKMRNAKRTSGDGARRNRVEQVKGKPMPLTTMADLGHHNKNRNIVLFMESETKERIRCGVTLRALEIFKPDLDTRTDDPLTPFNKHRAHIESSASAKYDRQDFEPEDGHGMESGSSGNTLAIPRVGNLAAIEFQNEQPKRRAVHGVSFRSPMPLI
jgi:hypothetical protein